MSRRGRKAALTAHVTASVGWLGAVAAFLALALAGLLSEDDRTARSACVALEVVGWFVVVPLCFASLLTGVVCAVGSTWGLARHYWVVVKLVITALATAVLLAHMQPVESLADAAASAAWSGEHLRALRVQLAAQSAAALVVLLAATALSVFKPQGRTRHGHRKAAEQRTRPIPARPPRQPSY
ncbi:hypothetical protein IPT68_01960 [Streptomyces chromofuscus]|uniref:Integral membrane protein n=1 Tax=Streptomyces chromofuscus TaxID=42881 RepID=A0A7M2THJ6_STRCW|nr:hypothetical protein IPT68_01960 [Streptomyces chromofuscus]